MNIEQTVSAAVADLQLGRTFTCDDLVHAIQARRPRRLRVVELAELDTSDGLCAIWLIGETEDVVLHAPSDSALHRQQFVLHEFAHMILGHCEGDSFFDDCLFNDLGRNFLGDQLFGDGLSNELFNDCLINACFKCFGSDFFGDGLVDDCLNDDLFSDGLGDRLSSNCLFNDFFGDRDGNGPFTHAQQEGSHMAKIAMIGAGSIVFCRTLLNDMLATPSLQDATYALMSPTETKLRRMEASAKRMVSENGLGAEVYATTDRREAIADADYVVCMVQVGWVEAFRHDYEIHLKYGVDQCIGDSMGPGGVLRGLRSIPVLVDMVHDMEQVAKPGALLLNYTNPMAACCYALGKVSPVPYIGLRHGLQLPLIHI